MIKKAVFGVVLAFVLLGCEGGQKAEQNAGQNAKKELRIALQYGLQYAPLYVANELGFLEQNLPNFKITSQSFAGGAAITEALIGGHLDVGCMGIPPALIAMDKGANFKIAFALSVPPSALITMDENIKSLKDFKQSDKIAVPGVGSIQHIMLSMGAKELLGDAHFFDKSLVTMKNPEAYAALSNKTDIKAHFASLPYLAKELESGGKSVFNASDIKLKTSIVCVVDKTLSNSADYKNLVNSIEKSIELINNKDEKALEIISKIEKIQKEEASKFINFENSIFSTKVYGLNALANHMFESGYIKKNKDIKEYFWDSNIIGE